MITSLLKYMSINSRQEARNENVGNGNDAEFLAASDLVMAIGAEISWGSRNEDGRKIDMICSYDHPWIEKERLIFLVQVKSGPSFGKKLTDGFKLKVNAINAAKRTTHPICIIWIDRLSSCVFWAYIHPNTVSRTQDYSNNHIVSPAMRFDIARCQSQFLPLKKGGSGIILKEKSINLIELRKSALAKYKKYQVCGLFCPILGNIEVSRIGWRHMFRKTRAKAYKEKSFTTIKYLDKIISDLPSKVYISNSNFFEKSEFKYRTCEYVMVYVDVKEHNSTLNRVKVIVRVLEEIRWPLDWTRNSTLTQFIERRNVLLSCYYK